MYAWGDNDHGQQGNGTTTVNRKPTLVQGLEGQKITRVACGSSHSVAWTTVDVATPSVHEPVLFQTARDPLGASYLGNLDLCPASVFRRSAVDSHRADIVLCAVGRCRDPSSLTAPPPPPHRRLLS